MEISQETQRKQYENIFKRYDLQKNKTMSTKDLPNLMMELGQNPTEKELEDMILELDPDGYESIDLNEFMDYLTRKATQNESEQDLVEVFKMVNKRGDGILTKEEFINALEIMEISYTDHDVETLFNEADSDKDGSLSYNEFANMLVMKW